MTTPRQPETPPIMAAIEVRLERREGETREDTQNRLIQETFAYFGYENVEWEGDTLVCRREWNLRQLCEWEFVRSIGTNFAHDFVVCPACERLNETK